MMTMFKIWHFTVVNIDTVHPAATFRVMMQHLLVNDTKFKNNILPSSPFFLLINYIMKLAETH
jgi:hypothetical protein